MIEYGSVNGPLESFRSVLFGEISHEGFDMIWPWAKGPPEEETAEVNDGSGNSPTGANVPGLRVWCMKVERRVGALRYFSYSNMIWDNDPTCIEFILGLKP